MNGDPLIYYYLDENTQIDVYTKALFVFSDVIFCNHVCQIRRGSEFCKLNKEDCLFLCLKVVVWWWAAGGGWLAAGGGRCLRWRYDDGLTADGWRRK